MDTTRIHDHDDTIDAHFACLGRLERIEVFRGAPDSEESVSIGFQCSRGHTWYITIHDRGGELAYTLRGLTRWPPIEEASSRGY